MDDFDGQLLHHLNREIFDVHRDDRVCSSHDRRRDDVAIIEIWKLDLDDDFRVGFDPGVFEGCVHRCKPAVDSGRIRHRMDLTDGVTRLFEQLLRPERPIEPALCHSKQRVRQSDRDKHARVEHGRIARQGSTGLAIGCPPTSSSLESRCIVLG